MRKLRKFLRRTLAPLALAILLPAAAQALEPPVEGDTIGFRGYMCQTEEARDEILEAYTEHSKEAAMATQQSYLRTGECGVAQGRAIVAAVGEPRLSVDRKFTVIPVTLKASPTSDPYYTFARLPFEGKSA